MLTTKFPLYTFGVVILSISPQINSNYISIKGHQPVHRLPYSFTSSWPVWTYEKGYLTRVEDHTLEQGWVNPSSFESLYFPSDLPPPTAQLGLGVVIANGSPRYVMPTVVLSLETASRKWRNRGLCSLPRARSWIDLFSSNVPQMSSLNLYAYGLSSDELRFLEDQDGSGGWDNIVTTPSKKPANKSPMGMLVPPKIDMDGIEIVTAFESIRDFLKSSSDDVIPILSGYHFVDIPLSKYQINLPRDRLKVYLTDFEEPRRLINYEHQEDLDNEPISELDIKVSVIAAGGSSDFLPDVYIDLFEPGSIIYEDSF